MAKLQALFVLAATVESTVLEERGRANPIRKVVTMLQMMQNKVAAEGAKKQEIYDKFMCYCDNGDELLGGAIKAAEQKIPMLQSAIGQDKATKQQLDADLVAHKADQVAAEAAIVSATALRAKDAAQFAKEVGNLKENEGALAGAIAEEKSGGDAPGFLQTDTANAMRQLSMSMDMTAVDRRILASFLGARNGNRADSITIGVLQDLLDGTRKDIAEVTKEEEDSIAEYNGLVDAKNKEIPALQASIESKLGRVGEIGMEHAEKNHDLDDTIEDLAQSKQFLADLEVNCVTKKKEWSAYQKGQAEETMALADTIKILNDDDALELFKKTLPGSSASFLQFKVSASEVLKRALTVLKSARKDGVADPRVDFLEVALRGGKKGFGKIVKMIDDLTAQLKKDQDGDDKKKAYCEEQFDKTEDKQKVLDNQASDLETMLDDETENVATLKVEIEALDDGIKAMDKEVAAATENRKEEHIDFAASEAGNAAAVDILGFAKNRLNKFYNPSAYNPPKTQLSEEDQILTSMGGTLAPAFVQGNAEPPPAPKADLTYKPKGEESTGVIRMIDLLVNDVETGMQKAKLEEKDAQGDYEKFMSDAAAKRREDSKSHTDKENALANSESALIDGKVALHDKNIERMETAKYLGGLHEECDWVMKNYDVRQEARTGEIEAMGKAKDVLNGADYSM